MWGQVGGQNPVRGLCRVTRTTDILTKTRKLTNKVINNFPLTGVTNVNYGKIIR
jgi:hypothetical protein